MPLKWIFDFPIRQAGYSAVPDQSGGLILITQQGPETSQMTDLDSRTGMPLWSFSFTPLNPNGTQPAIADDGTIYFWRLEGSFSVLSSLTPRASLVALDSLSGTPVAS
jgi:outer membrane protein assembly factor BamB